MIKSHSNFMQNPFSITWYKNWTFQIVYMAGGIFLEAKGLGIIIRKPFFPTEDLLMAADKLIYGENKNRQSLFNSWKQKKLIRN